MDRQKPEMTLDQFHLRPDREVLKTPIGTIRAGFLESHVTGKGGTFYYFDFPDWVNIVALTPRDEILLIRQFRYGTKRLELEIPGGMVESGESPIEAGCRELLEETGYAGAEARVIGSVIPNPALQDNYCHTILVEKAEQVTAPQPHGMEAIESLCLPEREIESYIANGLIEHGLVLNALSFYRRYKETSR